MSMNPLSNQPVYTPVPSGSAAAANRGIPLGARSANTAPSPAEEIAGSDTENINNNAAALRHKQQVEQQQLEHQRNQEQHDRRERLAVYDGKGRLVAHSGDEREAEFLREVVIQSQRHGREIEATIQHLSDMLRKKTVECEGLRTLAQENYDPVRRAVRREYEARVESEAKQQHQMRVLMKRVEELQAERQTLQQEVTSLKTLISELERKPPPSSYSEFDGSLFNRAVYGEDDENAAGTPPGKDRSASGAAAAKSRDTSVVANPSASWELGQGGSVLNVPRAMTQRDVLAGLSGLDAGIAQALESAQVFDFIKALLVRMCTRNPTTNQFPDLVAVVTSLLRERRSDPYSLAKAAQHPIPVAQVSDRQRVTQLFLANNPGQLQELEMLLTQYQGREGELYEQLRERFYSDDGKQRVAGNLQQHPSIIKSTSDALITSASSGTDPAQELSSRILLMYKKYNPQKLVTGAKELNQLMQRVQPEVLLLSLVEKYGSEPTAQEKRELLRGLVEREV